MIHRALPAAIAAGLSVLATPLARRLAYRLGAIDHGEDGREIPRLGGLAVLAATLGALVVVAIVDAPAMAGFTADGSRLAWLAAGVAVIVGAGVYDDMRGLGAPGKLTLQTAAALLALGGGYGIAGMTSPLSGTYVEFGPLAAVITVLWVLAITNAFNLIDGLDGLAAGVGAIASATLLAIALAQGRVETVPVWAALAGALAGFLVYNSPPASIFLGDTGSLLVGFVIAVLAIESIAKGPALVVVVAPVVALGLPITDVILAVTRRARAAGPRAVFRRDREHVHHRLLGAGLSERAVVLVLYAVCAASGMLAVGAVLMQGMADATVIGLMVGAIFLGMWLLRRVTRAR